MIAAVVIIACVTVFGVWSTRPTGFAGTFERAAIVVPMLWMYAFLHCLRRGTPLMVTPSAVPAAGTAPAPAAASTKI